MATNLVFCAAVFLCLGSNLVESASAARPGREVLRFEAVEPQVPRGQANKFQVNNCGHPESDMFNLTRLVVSPDPIHLPGVVTISAGGTLRMTARSPITLQVDIHKNVRGAWLTVPCIAQVGSCTYGDICALLELLPVCPRQLVDAGIPCSCPYQQGTYTLPESKFPIPVPVLPDGDYRVRAVATNDGTPVSCVEIYFSVD
ncbi:hypothetical protein EGW08_016693 [Elysia chlorotica]|uniref:MD-2-related lipid-recognition domain-containing protein n=1 Tax=Elysia chlorotica TaxID=188477 RepID=A0A433T1X5_ELYCH|nr:hypothetical protein EGW08_016693 [Elysia chlorotica]